MTKFNETKKSRAFISAAASRETSPEIMESIAFHARNLRESEALWENSDIRHYVTLIDIWETLTKNGRFAAQYFTWGTPGTDWF